MAELFNTESTDQLTQERLVCIEKDCQSKKMYAILRQCEDRVKSKTYTAETCMQEVIDLVETLDRCVGDKAFKKLV